MARPQILVINPNTSAPITAFIKDLASAEVGDIAEIVAVTASFGAQYISSRAAVSIAGHAVLDAYANALADGARPDAVIIGCFGDPGLDALRDLSDAPVFGFADGGLAAAAAEEGDFAIATIGEAWQDMLQDLVQRRGLGHRLKGIIALNEASRPPEIAGPKMAAAALELGATRLIVGGTGLIPVLDGLASSLPLPVIDPHRVTLHYAAAAAVQFNANRTTHGTAAGPIFTGLSRALNHLLEHGVAPATRAIEPKLIRDKTS